MENRTICGIYAWENKINGKRYIGQSTDCEKRRREHIYTAKYGGKDSNRALYRAINKYGIDNFLFYIICECEPSELNDKEKFFINEYDTMGINGYNMTSGGDCNFVMTQEIKDKISQAKTGHKNTKEHNANISSGLMGHKVSAETRERMSKAQTGHKVSGETATKISIANKGRKFDEERRAAYTSYWASISGRLNRPVLWYDSNLCLIKEFSSLTEAHNETHISKSSISECCNGKVRFVRGYTFRFKE